MKTTYLVNKEQADGSVYLTAVSSAEWLEVVESNKSLPGGLPPVFYPGLYRGGRGSGPDGH